MAVKFGVKIKIICAFKDYNSFKKKRKKERAICLINFETIANVAG